MINKKLRIWISAMRVRTIPLALSGTVLGSSLAFYYGHFRWIIFLLASSTAILLQIVSNLANDYGDGVKGTDNDSRQGPARALQSGRITRQSMKKGILLLVAASMFSGILLIYFGTKDCHLSYSFAFFVLGLAAIASAIKYTVGSKPYGYVGLGDLFVFIWFGLASVAGTFVLHTHKFEPDILLPASSLGLLSVGVLNINNLRDRVSDQLAGKKTLIVHIGEIPGKIYHASLIIFAIALTCVFLYRNYTTKIQFIFLVTFPFILINLLSVLTIKEPRLLDPYLKKLSIDTFFFSLTFGLGLILSSYV